MAQRSDSSRPAVRLGRCGWLPPLLLVVVAGAPLAQAAESQSSAASAPVPPPAVTVLKGMDDAVNGSLAAQAGRPPRNPYLDLQNSGDLWNLILLLGGGISGFVLGRNWDRIWGHRTRSGPG